MPTLDRNDDDTVLVQQRGLAVPHEFAPRVLAVLLRIEDATNETNALLRELVAHKAETPKKGG